MPPRAEGAAQRYADAEIAAALRRRCASWTTINFHLKVFAHTHLYIYVFLYIYLISETIVVLHENSLSAY